MKGISVLLLAVLALAMTSDQPPHCTRVSKTTDYAGSFKFNYPAVKIPPGEETFFQTLHCTSPTAVSEAETVVCDWAAPPQVQFTMEDGYVVVRRQDPAYHFTGYAVITTYQKCTHNIPPHQANYTSVPTITKMF